MFVFILGAYISLLGLVIAGYFPFPFPAFASTAVDDAFRLGPSTR